MITLEVLEAMERQLRSQKRRLEALEQLLNVLRQDMQALHEAVRVKLEVEKHRKTKGGAPC